jgi:hypothetical protein
LFLRVSTKRAKKIVVSFRFQYFAYVWCLITCAVNLFCELLLRTSAAKDFSPLYFYCLFNTLYIPLYSTKIGLTFLREYDYMKGITVAAREDFVHITVSDKNKQVRQPSVTSHETFHLL